MYEFPDRRRSQPNRCHKDRVGRSCRRGERAGQVVDRPGACARHARPSILLQAQKNFG